MFWCACGQTLVWAGNIWSQHNSQHPFDPYSFTHMLHGFMFCGLLAVLLPKLAQSWQWALAVVMESVWEVVENSNLIIQRYREATLALGYTGDTIINSFADILLCGTGFLVARKLGGRRAIAVFLVTELILLFWIKDSLLLNIVMLIYPVDAIKAWQMGR